MHLGGSMWRAGQSACATSSLATLNGSKAEYAKLLDTPAGRHFEANVADDAFVMQFAYLMAKEPGGDSGSATSTQTSGLACLPEAGVDEVMPLFQVGGILHEEVMDTLRLFGKHVIPHFNAKANSSSGSPAR